MPRPRATTCVLASAAAALVLSTGAALASDHPSTADIAAGKAKPPAGLCLLHDLGLKK